MGEVWGHFDKVAENSFKQIEGDVVYYPNGFLGKGRLIPDEATKERLFKFHKRVHKFSLFVVLPYSILLGLSHQINIGAFSPVLFFGVIMLLRQQYLIKGLVTHSSKLAFKDTVKNGSRTFPDWYYWVLALSSIGLIISSVWLLLVSNRTFSEMMPLFVGTSSMGLLGLGIAAKMYKLKNSK